MQFLAGMLWRRRYILACLTGKSSVNHVSFPWLPNSWMFNVLFIKLDKNLLMTFTFIVHRLVDKINVSIGQDLNSKSIIGVLDIYGFESFKCNR